MKEIDMPDPPAPRTPPPWCSAVQPGYCEGKKKKIDATCHDLEYPAGHYILYDINDKACYCVCSCVGIGTSITLADEQTIPIEAVKENQTKVLAAGIDLKFSPKVITLVSGTPPARTDNAVLVRYTLGGSARALVLTMDHPMLIQTAAGTRILVAAGALQKSDRLLDRNAATVAIDDLRHGAYEGAFWELATTLAPPSSTYDGHLVLTGGIVSGDFAISTFVNYFDGFVRAGEDPAAAAERPLVGSGEWRERNDHVDAVAPLLVNDALFTPAELHQVEVPAHASSFLPSPQAAALEEVAPKVPISNQYYLQECQWLIRKIFKPLYPDVEFLFNWYSETANTFSWVDLESGQSFVYLSGGLARIGGFEYEGVALALAHEIGHLLGRPTMRDGVTCEGEADFYGAAVVMRKLWFGEFYFSYTKQAVEQLELLYHYLQPCGELGPGELAEGLGDRYPSNACRIETIRAAMQTPDKPECAECVPADPVAPA
ncbi:MAG TPA: hypothetical protein VIJ51_13075 [Solirubrobacteraceae bacterium]